MATSAHCAYCFETLTASLEKRAPLTLEAIDELWDIYESGTPEAIAPADSDERQTDGQTSHLSPKPAAISRLLGPSQSSNSSSSLQSTNSSTPSISTNSSSLPSKSSSRTSFSAAVSEKLEVSGTSYAKATRNSEDAFPLFVTWNTISRSGNTNLRGCIGTFVAQPLYDGLRSYALTAAFEDHRFRPITLRELPSLECGVTLLTNFETISDPLDWEIGRHGLRINFTWNDRRYGSTYLPDVAREQQWNKEETIVSLMRKAGWDGNKQDWRSVKSLKAVRYRGLRVTLDYSDWKKWREWVVETGRD